MAKQIRTIDDLRQFIADNICQRREAAGEMYSSDEERENAEQELRILEAQAHTPQSVFKYAKWYSLHNELIVLESILWKLKDIEREQWKGKTGNSK